MAQIELSPKLVITNGKEEVYDDSTRAALPKTIVVPAVVVETVVSGRKRHFHRPQRQKETDRQTDKQTDRERCGKANNE